MRKIALALVILFAQFIGIESSFADGCTPINTSVVSSDGVTVTMTSITVLEKTGSYQLSISYTLKNNTADKKLDEGSFKLFFASGTGTPQYGGFNYLYPSDTIVRSYTWEYLKSEVPSVIEYGSDFFSKSPTASKPHWVAPGGTCSIAATPIATPTPTATIQPAPSSSATSELLQQVMIERATLSKRILVAIKMNPKQTDLPSFIKVLDGMEAITENNAQSQLNSVLQLKTKFEYVLSTIAKPLPTTIKCVKGKVIKKVTGVNPKCPSGYKVTK
jgi:hypothetical protein